VTDTCVNLAPIEERNVRILIPRISQLPPTSIAGTTATHSDSDNLSDGTHRKRRASRLSNSESTSHNLRSTRSRQEADPMSMEPSTQADLDTIVVRQP